MPNYIDELKSVIALGLPTIGLAGGLTLIVSSSLDLRVVNKSCTLALACFHLLWFWLFNGVDRGHWSVGMSTTRMKDRRLLQSSSIMYIDDRL